MDPISLLMFGLIGVLIFFMFRNGKKRQKAMQELQNGLRPGAEVMLQSGLYGTVEEVDDEENRVTIRSGTSTLIAHRNAVSQIIAPVEAPEEDPTGAEFAPDDDPAFGEHIAKSATEDTDNSEDAPVVQPDSDDQADGDKPKA